MGVKTGHMECRGHMHNPFIIPCFRRPWQSASHRRPEQMGGMVGAFLVSVLHWCGERGTPAMRQTTSSNTADRGASHVPSSQSCAMQGRK